MKIKKEYCVLVAVILALALYLILHNPDRTHYTLPQIPTVAKKDLSKIEISGKEISIEINKTDNRWRIAPQGYPADPDKVKSILDVLVNLSLTALVSEAKDYDRYDLDSDKRISVRAWAGERLIRDFESGKTAMSHRHTFVKIAGHESIYHAEGNFKSKFEDSVEDLRDKTVLSFEKSEIHEIDITKDRQSVVFNLKPVPSEDSADKKTETEDTPTPEEKTVWQDADGKEADESKLNSLLTTLSNLRCEKYINNSKKSDFTDPICTVHLKGLQEYTLSIFPKTEKGDKDYPAISSMNDYPFALSGQKGDNIMKSPGELLKIPDKT